MTTSKSTPKQVLDRLDPDAYWWVIWSALAVSEILALFVLFDNVHANMNLFILIVLVLIAMPAFLTGFVTFFTLSKVRVKNNHPWYNVYLLTSAAFYVTMAGFLYTIFITVCRDNHLTTFYGYATSAEMIKPLAFNAFVSGVVVSSLLWMVRSFRYSRGTGATCFRNLPAGSTFVFNKFNVGIILRKVSSSAYDVATYPDLEPIRIRNSYVKVYPQSNEQADTPTVKI